MRTATTGPDTTQKAGTGSAFASHPTDRDFLWLFKVFKPDSDKTEPLESSLLSTCVRAVLSLCFHCVWMHANNQSSILPSGFS